MRVRDRDRVRGRAGARVRVRARVHRGRGGREHGELPAVIARLLCDGDRVGVDGEPDDHGDEHRHGQLDLEEQPVQPCPDAVVAGDGPTLRAVPAARAREAGPDAEEDGEDDKVPHGEEAEAAGALVEGRLREDEEAPAEDRRAHQQQRALTHARRRGERRGAHLPVASERGPAGTRLDPAEVAHAKHEAYHEERVRRGRRPLPARPRRRRRRWARRRRTWWRRG